MMLSKERAMVWKEKDGSKGIGCTHCGWIYQKPGEAEESLNLRNAFREHRCEQHNPLSQNPS